jgi:probable H4MPT-linked C1 transfer pathway protein
MPPPEVFGWDVGGAHVKVSRSRGSRVLDVAQWPCPLWLGMDRLDQVLQAALQRWPQLHAATSLHAVTMTGEMVDHFAHREAGVQGIAAQLATALAPARVRVFAGGGAGGWCAPSEAGARWAEVASANWLATARHVAMASGEAGVLVDIGSTTTDFIAFGPGRVLTGARSDAGRLATGELVYHGVVRTPLCALGPRIDWRGLPHNVMNEFFATTADVYRLTGELDPAHDMHLPADNAGKDLPATRQRLARMVGLDARDGTEADWLAVARAWREHQLAELAGQLQRVLQAHGLGPGCRLVRAGCGAFLVDELAARCGLGPGVAYVDVAGVDDELKPWAQVCAPCIAVAALLAREEC